MKVAVIGIGGTGSAASRQLAQAGHEAVGFEQFSLGHDRGSSHGESRIIRYTYPDALYTQMMHDAYPLWDALQEEAGEELLVRCGGLWFGPEQHPNIVATEQALCKTNLPFEMLSPEAVGERFPAIRLRTGETAIYQPDSGFLRASRCVLANARLARSQGAVLHENAPVREILSRGEHVVVRTEAGGEEIFDRAIVTAGAWMGHLFERLNLPLKVTRQEVGYLPIRQNAEWFAPGRLPVWIDAGTRWYGFPSDGRVEGVKIAWHRHGEIAAPDRVRRTVDDSYQRAAAEYAAERLPNLGGEVVHANVCLYTSTPDEHFIIDRAPDLPNVWLVSGCSGHGFKFTVLLGKIAADLATGKDYPRNLSRFALSRAFPTP